MSALPSDLSAALATLLHGVSRNDLAARAATMSQHYRGAGGSASVVRDRQDALAYALTRMPATYAAVLSAMREAALRCEAAPQSLLDIGCGPGSASFAAAQAWPSLQSATLLDANDAFLDLARDLTAHSGSSALQGATFVRGAMERVLGELAPADGVVASYALVELPLPGAVEVATRLWALTRQVLVLVEPGSRQGFARLKEVRSALIAHGARVAAPCPHDGVCLMQEPDWCHFSVRLPRSKDHRFVKDADVPYEDEKFAYAVFSRGPVTRAAARLLKPALDTKAARHVEVCAAAGIEQKIYPRRDKLAFKAARRLDWGDALEGVVPQR
ncbi:small ribosomal subunit Rsm22 family protein [Methylovirgula sp. 4M-Z18]|uniref:small ribosomal subunit Rsm22 family protein n=1 Tax=Methylovirgula sp. 4M-Z18 TaxID=2293567 RepID=UPI000E2F89CE|nr:small ribosomal subunit Rsm22 family protein [Methylovirgula sp. 4M-Z18]RFB81303.1 methyltransferase domain-containing protein [Methylovirgula sp. 4M-Z18]